MFGSYGFFENVCLYSMVEGKCVRIFYMKMLRWRCNNKVMQGLNRAQRKLRSELKGFRKFIKLGSVTLRYIPMFLFHINLTISFYSQTRIFTNFLNRWSVDIQNHNTLSGHNQPLLFTSMC